MRLLDLTLESAFANVALDEALLESAEESGWKQDILRLWEPRRPVVVLGRSSIAEQEAQLNFCRQQDIPVVRRPSGGAAVVIGPGCLMYAVVLGIDRWPALAMLDTAHQVILQRNATALRSIGVAAQLQGISDLAVGDRKISGNSMRRKRDWVLYHGTLLYDFSATFIEQCLRTAPRQPEYRRSRSHVEIVASMTVTAEELRNALIDAWGAREPLNHWPQELTDRFVLERYSLDSWNFRR